MGDENVLLRIVSSIDYNSADLSEAYWCACRYDIEPLISLTRYILASSRPNDASLSKAVHYGRAEAVELILASPEYTREYKMDDLFNDAVIYGYTDIIKILRKHGASITGKSMMLAITNGQVDIVKYFLDETKTSEIQPYPRVEQTINKLVEYDPVIPQKKVIGVVDDRLENMFVAVWTEIASMLITGVDIKTAMNEGTLNISRRYCEKMMDSQV